MFDEDDRSHFVDVMRRLDIGYLNHVNKKLAANREAMSAKKAAEPRRVAKKRPK